MSSAATNAAATDRYPAAQHVANRLDVERRHATGIQMLCVRCADAGITRLGMPWRSPEDPEPLCMPCWHGQRQRRARAARLQLRAQLWEGIGAAELAARCPACTGTDRALTGDGAPAAAHRQGMEHAGARPPRSGCWRCGDVVWLRQAAQRFAEDQERVAAARADAAAAAAERAVARRRARKQVALAARWADRLRTALQAYRHGGSQGRPVALLADLLARDAAARSTRRGRPSSLARVAAVLAVDSDWRSGRRAMPGRAETALRAGCSVRAVSSAWARAERLEWMVRTRQGGRLSLVQRVARGRARDRAQFDVTPLHCGDPDARRRFVGPAIAVLEQLLEAAQRLLRQAQAEQAVVEIDERADRSAAALRAENFCAPHTVSQGRSFTSGPSLGLFSSRRKISYSPPTGTGTRPRGAQSGATRSSPSTTHPNTLTGPRRQPPPHPLWHPRKPYGQRPTTPHKTRLRRDWPTWAKALASDLARHWPWLTGPDVQRTWIIATLAARLGPDWTAAGLTRYISRQLKRPVMTTPERPVAYLRYLLDTALTADREPPHPARLFTQHRRAVAESTAASAAATAAQRRAEFDARDRKAVPAHRSSAAGELAALRARLAAQQRNRAC